MKISEIRRLILTNHEKVRSVMINDAQIEIVQMCSSGYVTSEILSDHLDISVQSAAQRLKSLFDKGYLNRHQVIQTSGGIEYRYYADLLEPSNG